MELTQRLVFTQELYPEPKKNSPEQIGFLGICGQKYPVIKGPNKIGRDPQTCNIVLNLNSVSRQHAVLNILSHKEFMIMDLDSANKTKLIDKILQPYIPHPIKNGDTVQFGDIFGIFRLFEEDTDLPMTQAIDMPDTPVFTRNISRLNQVQVTNIPESPDVSDKDDSYIGTSQPVRDHQFKSPNNRYIKTSGKTIAIQPVGSNKIDNVYWNSSKKSRSLNLSLNDSGTSLNDSSVSFDKSRKSNQVSETDIHEMETQVPYPSDIHKINDSIHTADTQVPTVCSDTLSIHSLDTQVPHLITEILPKVCKVSEQFEMQCDFYMSNKENDNSIFNAETQVFPVDKEKNVSCESQSKTSENKDLEVFKRDSDESFKQNESDDVILFDELDSQMFEENLDSQSIIPSDQYVTQKNEVYVPASHTSSESISANDSLNCDIKKKLLTKENINIMLTQKIMGNLIDDNDLPNNKFDVIENNAVVEILDKKHNSDSKKNVEDINILQTQKLLTNINDDELTDCEDESTELASKEKSDADFEDMPIQLIPEKVSEGQIDTDTLATHFNNNKLKDCNDETIDMASKEKSVVNFEDMPTQLIAEKETERQIVVDIEPEDKTDENILFEDLPTQVIDNDDKGLCFEELTTQIIDVDDLVENHDLEEVESPFKIPLQTPIRIKRKEISKSAIARTTYKTPENKSEVVAEEDEKYYVATQEILDDLCTQKLSVSESNNTQDKHVNALNAVDEIVPCSVENNEIGERFPHITDKISPQKSSYNKSSESSDGEEKIKQYASNLTALEIQDVIGINISEKSLKKMPSDPSDVDDTPKKVRSMTLMETELPDSQEIKKSVSLSSKNIITESSSESENDKNDEEFTPILYQKKKKAKSNVDGAKLDLTKMFNKEQLPTRIITRVRKPTAKAQSSDECSKLTKSILKPKFILEQGEVDSEIITENMSRLKSNTEKSKIINEKKGNKDSDNDCKPTDIGRSENTGDRKIDSREYCKNKTKTKIPESDKYKNKKTCKIEKKKEKSIENQSNLDSSTSKTSDAKLMKDRESKKSRDGRSETLENVRSTRRSRNKHDNDKNKDDVNFTTIGNQSNVKEKHAKKDKEKHSQKRRNEMTSKINTENKRNNKVETRESSPEMLQVRRSRRQRTVKDNVDSQTVNDKNKPLSKRNNTLISEQSTIYSISSESGVDSPKTLKRSATVNEEEPISKRSRSVIGSNASLRSTPARILRSPRVLFTAFSEAVVREVTVKLEKLGAVVVTDVTSCSVLVTHQIKRTFKLLCAVGLGRPIVGPGWVQACHDTNIIVDPWLYLIKDEAAEKRFHFNLEKTLISKRNFLKGYNVSSTPNVVPKTSEMKLIVECSGGMWKEGGQNWICITTHTDQHLWTSLKRRGATLVSAEFILGGVLRQQIDVKTCSLG